MGDGGSEGALVGATAAPCGRDERLTDALAEPLPPPPSPLDEGGASSQARPCEEKRR